LYLRGSWPTLVQHRENSKEAPDAYCSVIEVSGMVFCQEVV